MLGACFRAVLSNAVRVGADDGLTGIDAPVDWRWCSPTCQPALERSGEPQL
ncbi:MAG: hypothetical protein GDA36_07725 [Rhodobacteraceae bacterium]|nr:hypothetical protein [Paracoccaceae bacterium]